ncbi:peptidase family M3 [Aspergillus eucalypticola CBS 122712]|uniref:Peptidase family M3 n=1 Tax=Aspergillus eucalypticola (strain CBS 122712 / IBT 29274) TaxID=1448314 RepID=A0A317VWQ5_ASPEC|nr:peptidase family M3 [Aspergillus eucalypticola CBS 122712]PWY78784.1 peptidase family M3 [Aspergillus eucalypticola CBS 122712]
MFQLPRVPTTDQILPLMHQIIDQLTQTRNSILEATTLGTATFANTLLPLAQTENAVQGQLAMIDMLQYGAPLRGTQDVVHSTLSVYAEAQATWIANGDYFRLLQAVRDNREDFESLDAESQHLLERELTVYRMAGHGELDAEEVEGFLQEEANIGQIERKFQENLSREDGGVWFTRNELEGVPVSELGKWKSDGEQENEKLFVPFANGGTLAVLTYARRPGTRKKMFLADNQKLRDNQSLFEEIIRRRARRAHQLHHYTHAEYRLQQRMVKDPEWLGGFLNNLKDTLCARGKDEIAVLQQRRVKDLGDKHDTDGVGFPPWDKPYYMRLVEEEVAVDQLQLSEFYPLEQTAIGMLGIFASVLGLQFEPVEAEKESLWHESVRVFSVWESTPDKQFVGYLYFDLLWRENKYRGNQSVNLQCGYLRPDGSRQYPATILMCSFPTPTPTGCALLKHHQVVTLFHEMGHGIHDLLARTKYVRFHGYRLPPDFGEMPSMMLENWCWMKEVLQGLSCHYTTLENSYLVEWHRQHPNLPHPPKKIPVDLVDRLIKHRYLNRGLYHLYQLSISIFDLQIHSLKTDADISDLDVQKLWYDLREEVESMDFSECRDGYAFGTFSHLTAGYDVCYYAYLICTAMAQDVFLSVFAEGPFQKDKWEKYRREILQNGGGQQDLFQMLERFLGRPPNMNALVEGLRRADSQY